MRRLLLSVIIYAVMLVHCQVSSIIVVLDRPEIGLAVDTVTGRHELETAT
jgi:hypothetical protein